MYDKPSRLCFLFISYKQVFGLNFVFHPTTQKYNEMMLMMRDRWNTKVWDVQLKSVKYKK